MNRRRIFTILILICAVLTCQTTWAQELIDISQTVKRPASDKSISRDALVQEALETVSLENVKLLIGQAKAERNKAAIQNKIIKNSNKYILSMKAGNVEKAGNDVQLTVDLKVSLKNLRTLLLEEGLLYQLEGPPKVLPLVTIGDRVNSRQYAWWAHSADKENSFNAELAESFNKTLKEELNKIGFYGMSPGPANFSKSVPEPYRSAGLQRNDALFLGEFFKSSIVVRGEILARIKPLTENIYLVDVRLEALHSSNGRVLGEVVRSFETAPGPMRAVVSKKFQEVGERVAADMSVQLSEAWKKGTFGASLLKLIVRGSLDPRDMENFKKTVLLKVRDIKSLRERLLEAGTTTFEIDSSSNPHQLAQSFKTTPLPPYTVQVGSVNADGIEIKASLK
jgi:hypothetical protein